MFVWNLQGTSNAASRKGRENTCWEVLSPLPTFYIWAWAFGHHSSRDPALISDRCCAAPEVPWPSKPGHSSIWLHRPTIKYVMLQPWIFFFLNFGIPESKWWNILQSRWWVSELSGLFSEDCMLGAVESLEDALRQLFVIDAIHSDGTITTLGKHMAGKLDQNSRGMNLMKMSHAVFINNSSLQDACQAWGVEEMKVNVNFKLYSPV